LAWLGLAWLGLAWLGLAWLGLAWLGLAWLGLAWLGLFMWSSLPKQKEQVKRFLQDWKNFTPQGRFEKTRQVRQKFHLETRRIRVLGIAYIPL
jgi:hypothetical protein